MGREPAGMLFQAGFGVRNEGVCHSLWSGRPDALDLASGMHRDDSRIRDFQVIGDARSLSTLAHGERLSMLALLAARPMTGTMVARELGMSASRAHYHLRCLLEAGLLHEVEKKERRRTEERFFVAGARHFVVDPSLACRDPETAQAVRRSMERAFEEWRRREVLAIDFGEVARSVVSDSLQVRAGEHVLVMFGLHGLELAEAIMVELEAVGAFPRPKPWSRNTILRTLDRHSEASLAALPILEAEEEKALSAVVFVSSYMPEGPPPSPAQRAKLGLRMETASRWQSSLRERGVRYLEVSLPHRGEFPGDWTSPEEGIDVFWRCLTASPGVLRDRAQALLDRVAGQHALNLSCPRGSRLTVEIDPARIHVSDGVIDDYDLRAGRTADVLPAGSLSFLPLSETADGVLVADYAFAVGRHFRDLRLEIRSGRIVKLEGAEDVEALRERIAGSTGDPDLIAEVRFGLNPGGRGLTGKFMLDACLAGVVTVSFGNNELLGGPVRSTLDLWLPARGMTVHAGETVLVEDGTLFDEANTKTVRDGDEPR